MRKFVSLLALVLMFLGAQATRINLSTLSGNKLTLSDGDELYGSLTKDIDLQIPDGATITLDNASINPDRAVRGGSHAGLTVQGNAIIILKGTNEVTGFGRFYPGIFVAKGFEVLLREVAAGGSLHAQGGKDNGTECFAPGIGAIHPIKANDEDRSCGSIVIESGTILAEGGSGSAGIGSTAGTGCGSISIWGGNVTAVGGQGAAAIGSGTIRQNNSEWVASSCGPIFLLGGTITATGGLQAAAIGAGLNGDCGAIYVNKSITKVTATKGKEAPFSLGAGLDGTSVDVHLYCDIRITEDGNYSFHDEGTLFEKGISDNPFVYPADPVDPEDPDPTPEDPDPTPIEPDPTCETPLNLKLTELTYNSATVTWNPGSSDQTEWLVGYHNDPYGTWKNKLVTERTFTMTGLSGKMKYMVVVRAKCDEEHYSDFATLTFTTPAEPKPEPEPNAEVYATFWPKSGELTFYYDTHVQDYVSAGYTVMGYNGRVNCYDGYDSDIKHATIDISMQNAQLEYTKNMFYNCTKMTAVEGIENIPTTGVTDMSGMFFACKSLVELDLSLFDMSQVTDMHSMFLNCENLKTIYCMNDWTQIAPENTVSGNMFYGCSSLQGGKGTAHKFNSPHDITYARPDGGTDAPGFFTDKNATGLEITNDQLPMTNKIIRDNQLFILRGDKIYTVTGQEVK